MSAVAMAAAVLLAAGTGGAAQQAGSCAAGCCAPAGGDSPSANRTGCAGCECPDHKPTDEGFSDGDFHELLLALVLIPFLGRFSIDWLLGAVKQKLCPARGPEFRTCLDRPFVQKEINWAKLYGKPAITVRVPGD